EELLGADDQHLVPALFLEVAHRHAVLLEEADEGLPGDAAILAAGDAVAAQPAGIEPLAHRPRRDLADFRDLAGGEHLLHCRHSIFRVAESSPRPATAGGPAGELSHPPWRAARGPRVTPGGRGSCGASRGKSTGASPWGAAGVGHHARTPAPGSITR